MIRLIISSSQKRKTLVRHLSTNRSQTSSNIVYFDSKKIAERRVEGLISHLNACIQKKGVFEYDTFRRTIKFLDFYPNIDKSKALFLIRGIDMCIDLFHSERQDLLEKTFKILPKCNVIYGDSFYF